MMPASRPRRARGFALIVTIVLVAFLVLILVGLATFTRVETQVAGNTQQLSQARQNALMALNLAVGELQRAAGPDQRVTAPSALGTATAAGSDLQPHLTRVWRHDPGTATDLPTRAYSPKLVSWLVSGNENMDVDAPTVTPAMIAALPEPAVGNDVVWLVNDKTVEQSGTINAANPDKRIRLNKTPIRAAAGTVPGIDPADTPAIGHYAWWVGDEGVKARVNTVDAYAGAAAGSDDYLRRLLSAQRTAPEAMTGIDALAANSPELLKVISDRQLPFAAPAVPAENWRGRFHDVTAHSAGLFTDTRSGGLRRDLSYLLAISNDGDFGSAIEAAWADVTAGAPARNTAGALPVALPGHSVPSGFPTWAKISPTWEQLRSFQRLASDVSAAGVIAPRPQTAFAHGVYPVLVRAQLFFGLRREQVAANNNTIWLHAYPLFVLANPYNVTLADATYTVRLHPRQGHVAYGTDASRRFANWRTLYGEMRFEIRSGDLAPGEARVYTLATDGTSAAGWDAATLSYSHTNAGTYRLANEFNEMVNAASIRLGATAVTDAVAATAFISGAQTAVGVSLWGPGASDYRTLLQHADAVDGIDLTTAPNMRGAVGSSFSPEINLGGGFFWNLTDHEAQNNVHGHVNYVTGVNLRAPMLSNQLSGPGAVRLPVYGFGGAQRDNPAWYDRRLETDAGLERVKWGLNFFGNAAVSDTVLNNVLYDLPRTRTPLVSLGQLQHFNAGGFLAADTVVRDGTSSAISISDAAELYAYAAGADRVLAYSEAYVIAHSRASPLIFRQELNQGGYHDTAYLLNLALWDRFFFSSYPQSGAFSFGTGTLTHARYRPFRAGQDPADTAAFRGDARSAAANLLSLGAFNVNSTSVEAWKALLRSAVGLQFNGLSDAERAPFPRTFHQPGGWANANNSVSENAWNGFRMLSESELDQLATQIVQQVRRRGPFLNLADFVNRRLITSAADTNGIGVMGALEAAIAAAGLNPAPTNSRLADRPWDDRSNIRELDHRPPNLISGHAGWLSQGDLLQPLAPHLTARSDTFRIRVYGETVNPVLDATDPGYVTGRAWAEAIVQRLPDFVGGEAANTSLLDASLSAQSRDFGRRFHVVSFRWLTSEYI